MLKAQKVAANFEGEAIGALIASPHYSPRRRRRLQRMGNRLRRVRIALETVFEEDPSWGSDVEDECFVPASRECSYVGFMDQLKCGLGIQYKKLSPFILFLLFSVVSFVVAFSCNGIQE